MTAGNDAVTSAHRADVPRQQHPARTLAGCLIASTGLGRTRTTVILAQAALCWGVFARGGFFLADRLIFTTLCLAALVSAWPMVTWQVVRWWCALSTPVIAAIAASGLAHGAYLDIPIAVSPIICATALGIAGSTAKSASERAMLQRALVDVTAVLALLCWIGVTWHLDAFASLLNQGWRADAGIGYANVTGVVVGIGALISARLAAASRHVADLGRCALLMSALAATQSRVAIVAMLVAMAFLLWRRPRTGSILFLVSAPAAIATLGLIPSVRAESAHPLEAICAAAASGLLLIGLGRWYWSSTLVRVAALILATTAALSCGVLLRGRVLDSGSASGHLRLWQNAVETLRTSGVLGEGPREAAQLSRGDVVVLLAHNDVLQNAGYYGIPALIAGVWILRQLLSSTVPGPVQGSRARLLSPVAGAVVLVVAVAGSTDFPLEVPVVPALVAFVIGMESLRIQGKPTLSVSSATPQSPPFEEQELP